MIRVENVSKRFRLYRKPSDRLKEILLRRRYHSEHQALRAISFQVEQGRTLGIIGQNGAGKSTLLKILTGVQLPDSGSIHVSGHITGLLELGTGFNLEMSGLENIRSNAALLGMSQNQLATRRQDIIDFAELGEFIHEPLKTYSSGMLMRLGFAIAIHAHPTCFVVDEALSVGDAYFQQKCMRAIHAFRDRGGSVLFVSHDMNAVKSLCDEAILLEGGQILDRGTPKDVVDHYHGMLLRKSHRGDTPVSLNRPDGADAGKPLAGTGEVELVSIQLLNEHHHPVRHVTSERELTIHLRLRAKRDLDAPHYGMGIRNRFGHSVFETNTSCVGVDPEPLLAGQVVTVEWHVNANLRPGDYAITVGVANRAHAVGSFDETLLFLHDAAMLEVGLNPEAIRYDGYFNMRPQVCIALEGAAA
ncbi:ABC transporter ATP-binding protein [Ectothiorhodospira variabilis]|uniref:ABC transporter ATP-binding protein n=1 Tax=Ectothiorhodospira variabilis TaxID=505694 RepID=UPI001EFA2EEA|nr:ABC transporter ATP-binding protein [Ectothiorhodospira variabilis]MCG5495695.1 ABC transporter ATP-binding protein [Ectothiorhodospira variabilis]MCG5504591.1 ABC transporter ATP-binding protein [Ectothiorhodospira variabilis]MCG5507701.1 ABC transporter ATP-binding protein [Ectothiorhodospira variabilis]